MKATDHDKTVLSGLKKSPIGRGNLRAVETLAGLVACCQRERRPALQGIFSVDAPCSALRRGRKSRTRTGGMWGVISLRPHS